MKNINFVIDSLDIGGAETYLVEMLNNIPLGINVKLITIFGGGVLEEKLPENVTLESIFPKAFQERTALNKAYRFVKLKYFTVFNGFSKHRLFNDKDALYISFLENTSCAAVSKLNNNKICWIHTDISKQESRFKHSIKTYESFNKIVFVSNASKQDFEDEFSIVTKKEVIYNCVNFDEIKRLSKLEVKQKVGDNYTVSIGRLCEAKDYMFLLKELKILKQLNPSFLHYIIGAGPDKEIIEKKIVEYDLVKNVFLLGQVKNPFPYLKNAKALIMTSKWEGFGLVILESLVLDVPVIATELKAQLEIFSKFVNYDTVEKKQANVASKIIALAGKPYVQNDVLLFTEFSYENFWNNIIRLNDEI